MPTLVLPPRFSSDTIAVGNAAEAMGWRVERLSSWRVPEWLVGQDVVLYGEPLFAEAVAESLAIVLLEPTFSWLPTLPATYRQRSVALGTLAEARGLVEPAFIKPADDKCFTAKVYESGSLLPNETVLSGHTPVLIAEPVKWDVEFRCFVLEREIVTLSPYLKAGQLAQDEEGDWIDPRMNEAREFAAQVVTDSNVPLPPAVVIDVGLIAGRGWAALEANAAWGSGIYGCDPSKVLRVVRRSCLRPEKVTELDRPWVIARG